MKNELSGTIAAWSKALHVADETLISKLKRIDYVIKPGQKIPVGPIFKALLGEKDQLKLELLREQKRKEERENNEAEKNLIVISEAEKKLWNDLLAPLKVEVELIADKIAALCNPDHPELAHKQLTAWSEQTKKQILQSYE
ncbi:MAG: hypothetical protein KGL39_21635 [Patescibacteria group bacterium]|nr:hypothetical protein [Patescibacteria group bacterium]